MRSIKIFFVLLGALNLQQGIGQQINKIPVLNVGSFHMRVTPDENAVSFELGDDQIIEETRILSRLIASFNPTIICVEIIPEEKEALNIAYQKYLATGKHSAALLGEVSLVAFEVGKLVGVDTIYGINHLMAYDHLIDNKIENTLDPEIYQAYTDNPLISAPGAVARLNEMNTIDKIRTINRLDFQEFLINENADILTHTGTEGNFEGADEAAKFYQRNLRMYSNLNRIKMDNQDRVFILMGGTHTAFFNQFLRRSPKYDLVDVSSYLN